MKKFTSTQANQPVPQDNLAHSLDVDEEEFVYFPILSEFKFLEEICKGGMGVVYKVYDRKTNQICALKVLNTVSLLPNERNEEIARFRREAEVAKTIDHPNAIAGGRMGCERGIWYYTMECVDGIDLGSGILDEEEVLTEDEVIEMAMVVAEVLEYLNRRHMVHRDIKPDNILRGYDGTLKLCDYGLIRDLKNHTSITATGISLGTPNYMSPEQARGDQELDIRSDLYALGITMFHMLVGEAPFESSSVTVTLSRHLFEDCPDIREYDENISAVMSQIIQKMTAKNPEDRFQSPTELIQILKQLQAERKKPSARLPQARTNNAPPMFSEVKGKGRRENGEVHGKTTHFPFGFRSIFRKWVG